MDALTNFLQSFAKALPVAFASRTAFAGVLLLTIAGGFHEHRNTLYNTTTEIRLQELKEGMDAARDIQIETKKELNQRLDRLEGKVDRLLLERKKG